MLKIVDNNETILGRGKFTEMWEDLTIELNKLGPPSNPTNIWRRKWVNYKYENSNKRIPKRLKLAEMTTTGKLFFFVIDILDLAVFNLKFRPIEIVEFHSTTRIKPISIEDIEFQSKRLV